MDTEMPAWIRVLDAEDWQFLKRFLLASGSLKALAEQYDISYPTVRGRLDRLIAKAQAADESGATDVFHRQLRALVAEGRLDRGLARRLLAAHRESLKEPETDSPADAGQ
jgi:hypothetical protein